MSRGPVALLAIVAGCFSPTLPQGAACSETGRCPGGQTCVDEVCVSESGPPRDAASPVTDAGPDAAPDADLRVVPGARCQTGADCGPNGVCSSFSGSAVSGYCSPICPDGDGTVCDDAFPSDFSALCVNAATFDGDPSFAFQCQWRCDPIDSPDCPGDTACVEGQLAIPICDIPQDIDAGPG